MFNFLRNDTIDKLVKMNDYLRVEVMLQKRLLRGQLSRIELLQKEVEKWKRKRDKRGRFVNGDR